MISLTNTASAMMPRIPRLVRSDDLAMALRIVSASMSHSRSRGWGASFRRYDFNALRSSSEHSSTSLLIAASDSLICWSTWLLGCEGFNLGSVQEHLARDLEYPEPSFLNESGNGLPRHSANTSRFRL